MKTIPEMLDIGDPERGVEIELRDDAKVLWISVDGVTVLRIQNIPQVQLKFKLFTTEW